MISNVKKSSFLRYNVWGLSWNWISTVSCILQNTGAKYVAQTFIMEQYLDGPEVDVDLVMSGGEAVYGAITDNWPTVEP